MIYSITATSNNATKVDAKFSIADPVHAYSNAAASSTFEVDFKSADSSAYVITSQDCR